MIGLTFILSGICWGQEARVPEFTKFEFIRERIGHKVLVEGTMVNTLGVEMSDIRLTALYFDGNRELRRTKTTRIAKVAPGAKADFTLEADQTPNFTRYELYLEYGPTTRLYTGDEKAQFPAPKKAALANLLLGSFKDTPPKSFPGDALFTLTVRNDGGSEAEEPTAVLGLTVRGEAQLYRVLLDRAVEAGTEATFEVILPGVEAYTSREARVTFISAEGPRAADAGPTQNKIEVRSLRMVRLADGSGRVTGSFRNGLRVAVGEVTATLFVGKTDVPYKLPGTLAPGETSPFELYLPACPSFDGGGGYEVDFKEVQKAEPRAASRAALSKRTASRAIETRQIKLPPPPVPSKSNDPELNAKTRIRDYAVGIRGLMVVDGSYGKAGKYTGDVYLLRFIFIDDEGKPMKPTPTINMTVYNKDQAWGRAQRIVAKEQWSADATKINALNVADNTIACDKKSGELWVAFVRTDGPTFEPRLDITVVIPDLGTWSWKGLSGKFEVAAKTADSH